MSRQQKLKALDNRPKLRDPKLRVEDFSAAFDERIEKLAELLGEGVDINNIDALVDELSKFQSIQPLLADLTKTLGELKIPGEIKLKADKTQRTPSPVKVEWLNDKEQRLLTSKLDKIVDAVNKEQTQSQQAEDYIPFRRVVKVEGVGFKYDDSFYTGGGGGGGINPALTRNNETSIAVVNPDGTPIGGSSGGGAVTIADGSDIAEGSTTDAAVDTDTTGTVSGKLRGVVKLLVNLLSRWPASLGQKTSTGSLPVIDAALTTRIDEASGTVTYIGTAAAGAATSAASWQVKKIDSSSGTSILFADGNINYDNIWDDRASLSYS